MATTEKQAWSDILAQEKNMYDSAFEQIIPAKHPNDCLCAFEVADWLPLARAYLSSQTGKIIPGRPQPGINIIIAIFGYFMQYSYLNNRLNSFIYFFCSRLT